MQPAAPLPTKNGVGPSCVSLPPGPWPTIAAFLAERFPDVSAATWQQRMQQGELVDARGTPVHGEQPYSSPQRPQCLYYYRSIDDEPRVPFDEVVLFQDPWLIAVDKPHFLPVIPGGKYLQETLLVRLKRRLGIDTLAPLHRLDRETAGVVLFSVQPASRAAYSALFAQRLVTKHYEAIVHRPAVDTVTPCLPLIHRSRLVIDTHFMRMREAPGEANSETQVELSAVCGNRAHLRLLPTTGRKHQLRVHCAALGLPIVGDRLYPALLAADTDDHMRPLQLLARSIAFVDPISGEARRFASNFTLNAASRDGK